MALASVANPKTEGEALWHLEKEGLRRFLCCRVILNCEYVLRAILIHKAPGAPRVLRFPSRTFSMKENVLAGTSGE